MVVVSMSVVVTVMRMLKSMSLVVMRMLMSMSVVVTVTRMLIVSYLAALSDA